MSESLHTGEIGVAAEVIAGGITAWLKKVNGSDASFEQATSDYRLFMESLALPYSETGQNGHSENSPRDPLTTRTMQFLRHYEDLGTEAKNIMLARQLFWAQTYIAHLFRLQNMLQASDENDFFQLLQKGHAAGIDIGVVVDEKLEKMYTTVPQPDEFYPAGNVTIEDLALGTTTLNERYKGHVEALHQNGHFDAGEKSSLTIVENLDLQTWWTELAVDYVIFGAGERGGRLTDVPSLDPASTSQHPILSYPFATA